MPRVKLTPMENYPFSVEIAVRTTDLNYGGHLGNDSLLALIHEARVAFLKKHGLSEKNFGGISLIIADTAIVYQGEAFEGDILKFEVAAGEPTRSGFRMFFRVTRIKDKVPIALVENGLVCFDYDKKTIQQLPEEAHHIF